MTKMISLEEARELIASGRPVYASVAPSFVANYPGATIAGMEKALRAQTIAIFSYIDPVIAILLSVTVLHEPFTILSAVGSVLILGAAFVSEKT